MMDAPTNHHKHDSFFISDIMGKLPRGVLNPVSNIYNRTFDQQGRQAANLYLVSVQEVAAGKSLLVADDDTLKRKADQYSKVCKAGTATQGKAFCQSLGIQSPQQTPHARLSCAIWWERQLKRKQDREQEALAVQLGFVRKAYQPYASTALMNRIQARHKRSMEVLAGFEAVSDDGDKLDLLKVLEGSTANPAVRRAELMVRMKGFEQYANENNHVGMFYTITAPSKYHRYSGANLNDKYQNYTPRDTQAYLCSVWAKITAKLHRDDLPVYGFRVVEPHQDGTPHWHMLLFMDKAHCDTITDIMRGYAFAEDGDEKGAAKHRFDAVTIDPNKGSAAGYIAKYVSKNIDGYGMDLDDESGVKADESAKRVRAWSSVWGIRQFQQIGGCPVGVWRELRRVDSADHELLEQAREYADAGDWCGYLRVNRADLNRKAQPLRVFTVEPVDPDTGELKTSRYGEVVSITKGLSVDDVPAIETRIKTWTIQEKANNPVQSLADLKPAITFDILQSVLDTFTGDDIEKTFTGSGAPSQKSPFLSSETATPCTRVNNSTQEVLA